MEAGARRRLGLTLTAWRSDLHQLPTHSAREDRWAEGLPTERASTGSPSSLLTVKTGFERHRLTWSAASAGLAVGAVALYVLGVITAVGRLRASGVDVSAGLSVMPVERHMRSGIGVVSQPMFWISVGVFAGIYGLLRRQERLGVPQLPSRVEAALQINDRILDWVIPTVLLLMLASAPWDVALVLVPVVVYVIATRVAFWAQVRPTTGMALLVAWIVISLFASAVFRGQPLPVAAVATPSGVLEGALLALDGDTIYLAREGHLYSAAGLGSAARIDVKKQRRDPAPSLLELVGIRNR